MNQRLLLLGLGMLVAAACSAHEGEVHRDEQASVPLSAAALAERPRRLPNGELFLPSRRSGCSASAPSPGPKRRQQNPCRFWRKCRRNPPPP